MSKNTVKSISILSLGTATLLMASGAQALNFKVDKTDVDVYGYAKLDVIYDVDANLTNTVNRGKIRLDDTAGVDGHTTMHAFQSRLGLTTTTALGDDVLKTNVEGDFYGNGGFADGGGGFRLRHAYGVWKGVLAGQTWSNFGNTIGLFPTVDFNGPMAMGGGRQAQLRYTTGKFSFSAEDPQQGGTVNSAGNTQYRLPDMTARYQNTDGPVQVSVAGLARFLEYDAEGANPINTAFTDDSAMGWGVTLEAKTQLTEAITLRGSITHGDGIGGYLYISPSSAPGYVDSAGNLETIEATGGGASVSVAAGPGSINLGYGVAIADLDNAYLNGDVAATENERFSSTFVNYIWSPVDRITYGLEAGYHTREQVNGKDGSAVRLQAMLMFGF
ncbi:MAG: DcaP family trimeric outer membrane transporter [Marinobacter sp.]